MKKAIIKSKSEYDRGTYTITNAGKWNGIIWDFQLNGVIADLKADGYKVYINDFITPIGSFDRKEILKLI